MRPSPFIRFGRPRSATSLIFRNSFGLRLTSLPLSKIIDPPSRSWTPVTRSSGLPTNATPRTCGQTGGRSKNRFLREWETKLPRGGLLGKKFLIFGKEGVFFKNKMVFFLLFTPIATFWFYLPAPTFPLFS